MKYEDYQFNYNEAGRIFARQREKAEHLEAERVQRELLAEAIAKAVAKELSK